MIVFAELLAARHPELAAEFRDWSTAEATWQHSRELLLTWRASRRSADVPHGGTATDPMSAVIQLEPCAHARDRYVYTIWRYREAVVSVAQENEPLRLSEIIARLKGAIPALLGQLPSEHVIVEFILPLELFDEPVHQWQVFPRAFVRLGYRYPVVIRDWERINDKENRNHAMIKWDWLSTQGTTPLQWITCTDRRTGDELYPWFEARERAALGLPGPSATNTEAFAAALDAGVRVALWRLTPCGAHGSVGAGPRTSPCEGVLFQQTADEKVVPTPLHLLPGQNQGATAIARDIERCRAAVGQSISRAAPTRAGCRVNNWLIYRGTGEPHGGADDLPSPPPWRTFDGGPTLPIRKVPATTTATALGGASLGSCASPAATGPTLRRSRR